MTNAPAFHSAQTDAEKGFDADQRRVQVVGPYTDNNSHTRTQTIRPVLNQQPAPRYDPNMVLSSRQHLGCDHLRASHSNLQSATSRTNAAPTPSAERRHPCASALFIPQRPSASAPPNAKCLSSLPAPYQTPGVSHHLPAPSQRSAPPERFFTPSQRVLSGFLVPQRPRSASAPSSALQRPPAPS